METVVYCLVPVLMFGIWRAELIDRARLENEHISREKDCRLKSEQAEYNEYILNTYRELSKHGKG